MYKFNINIGQRKYYYVDGFIIDINKHYSTIVHNIALALTLAALVVDKLLCLKCLQYISHCVLS